MPRSSGNIRDRAPNSQFLLFSSADCAFLPVAQRPPGCRGRPAPVNSRARAVEKESAVKPGSVLDSHSSGMRVAAQL